MVRVKHMTHPIGDKASLEATDMASKEVTKALSPHMQDSVDVASSPNREGSLTNTGDSESESRSTDSDDELTTSESDIGKACIRAMELHPRYFPKGHARPPGPETIPTPQQTKL
jgi:hypothetical protein